MTSKYKVSNGGDRHDDLPAKDIVLACGATGAALPINSGPVPIGFLPPKWL